MVRKRARFCNSACADGFREDRRCGLIYGPHKINDVWCRGREEWSLVALACAYCGAAVAGRIPAALKEKFGIKEGERK